MNYTKTKFKRSAALVMAMIMTATAIVSALITTVKALGTETEVFMSIFPRDGDPNYDAEWGHGDMTYMNGWTAHETDHITLRTVGSNDGDICYCIEPGVSLDVHDKLVDHDESFWDNYPSQYNKTIEPDDIKLLIGRIMQYGFTGSFSRSWNSVNEGADKLGQAMATQILIWETVVGERDADFNHVSTGGKDAVLDIISATNPIRSQIMKYYGSIVTSVQNHTKLPSFFARSTGRAETVDLEWDGSKYTASLTDTNGVLSNYTFSSDTRGVDVSVSGNKLVITSDSVPDGSVTITATKKSSQRRGIITWTDGEFKPGSSSFQDMVTYTQSVSDPVVGYLKVGVSLGGAKIVKTSEDGNVSGVQFRVTGSGYDETFRTNASGVITIDSIAPGRYTVTELTENKYEPQESMTLNVVSGETATVTFSNVLKRGDLTVTKTSEDGIVDGVRFHLYGTSESGLPVDEYATTDGSGKAYFTDVLIGSGYTLEEVGTDNRYTVPDGQNVDIEWDEVTTAEFHNTLRRGELTVTKRAEDGSVEGIRFHIYGTSDNGDEVDEYAVTDRSGKARFDDIPIGSGYTVEEVDTPNRYLVPDSQNADVKLDITTELTFENVLKRGDLTVTKTSEDGLVEGMRFHLYGTSLSGIAVDEYATTDESGKAYFKNILMGSGYTLEEVGTPDRYVIPDTQSAAIEWNTVTNASFHNSLRRGELTVTKSAEDGKVEGVKFHLYGKSYSRIAVDEYAVTDSEGKAHFKNILIGSGYTLEEVETGERYIVPDGQSADVEWDSATQKYFENKLKRGSLTVTKTSEDSLVEGMRFHLYGTSLSGIAVDEYAVTDSTGKAYFKDILIGTGYTLEEVDTAEKYIIPDSQSADIAWNSVTEKSFDNVLKRGDLTVTKTSEDNLVEGMRFRLYGTSLSGIAVDEYAVTDSTGKAYFKNILIGSNYTLEEVDTAEKYIVPDGQSADIAWNSVTERSFNNVLKRGDLTVTKTSEDNLVEGMKFRLYGTSLSGIAVDEYATTDSSGKAYFEDILIGTGYTLEEVDTAVRYIVPDSQSADIEWNTVTKKAFENILKRVDLTVTKTAEDGLVEGLRFHLYGMSTANIEVDEYATTDESGKAYFKDILIGSEYTLEEVGTPERYVVPAAQSAAVEWNTVTQKSVHNILKKWNLTVSKSDSGSGKAQGDATLAGAVYGIYKNGELVDRYSTDANGQFTTKWYVCGGDWELRELTPSEGYMIDTETYHIGAEAGNFTAEYSPLSEAVTEDVIKGMISIIKHNDDGETKIETPEGGAEFDVYLKSSGSYEDAAETERAHLVCDENGYAETPLLPYGIYTIHQTKGWDGRELMHDFDVYVSENGKVYRFLINNAVFESLVEIVKKDAETGAIIPAAGIGFKVKNADTGEFVVQHINYPTPTDIDVYYTDVTGKLMLPDTLPFGNYEAIEVQTPYGYVLDGTPVPFTVDGNETVVTVEKSNMPQKGTVTVTKSGEVFATVTEIDGIYVPVYEVRGLAGAVFEIAAAEDIYTPDGTLRYAAGTVVDTITTDETGAARSGELYLGKYEVQEITAPNGYVLNREIHTVELSYAGQNVSVTETSTEFSNERQRVSVALEKLMEEDEKFGITGSVTAVTFGLYASEDIEAADGTVIPKDGLIEILSVDENGHAECRTDLMFGEYYLRELTTDERYVLDGEKYTFKFEYAGQDIDVVHIDLGDIENELIQGNIRGEKSDRETGEHVTGAVFGLFMYGETVYTEKTAVMLAVSDSDGRFGFDGIPYGRYFVVELSPADGYLPNGEKYEIVVSENEAVIELDIVNDKIPEIGTAAAADSIKSTHPTESVTIEDTVAYEHLVPGKEYMLKGVLMDKGTGKPFLVDGEEVRAETTFTPDAPSGTVKVSFTFDASGITSNTELVVFETLYLGDVELTAHADIEDESQTVTVLVPEIGTTAAVGGEKSVTAKGDVTIDDAVSFKNLIPCKEYKLKGVLMDKGTGKPFLVDGKEITSEVTFTPETAEGEVTVSFTFNASGITENTNIVVFESLYMGDIELTAHADIEDESQTVTVLVPEIGTTATVGGGKSVTAKDDVTIDDVVSFKNLIPGKEYRLKGVLMDKATGKPFLVDGKEITTELTFTPETADGEVRVSFTFNADIITSNTELVVFETLYLGDVELTAHADIEDEAQTVTLTPPPPETPKTGDDSSLALWIAITGISFMGALISAAAYFKAGRNGKKK